MTEQDAFLHAICTNPDDDTTRLVYADCLDEYGEHDRAEFIRVGCEIAGVPLPPELDILRDGNKEESLREMTVWRKQWGKRYYSLRTRSAELLRTHERDWRGGPLNCAACGGSGELARHRLVDSQGEPAGYHINDCGVCDGTGYSIACTWTRGFVSGIECPLEVLTSEVAKAIWRVHPVTSVRVSDREPDEPFWWWWRDGDGTYRSNRAYLPNYVFNKIDRPHILSLNGVHCESETEAMKLASNAWVAWGREQAGLPQLEMKC